MENFFKFLHKIEKYFLNKNKKETVDFTLNGEVYEVLLLKRIEKINLLFKLDFKTKTVKDVYEWLKPSIYKCFQLQKIAEKSIEEGYIQTHYEVIEALFDADEIIKIMDFIIRINKLESEIICHLKD